MEETVDIISGLKAAGYRWSSKKKLWYAKKNNKSMDFAKSIGYNPSEVVELKQDENKEKVGSDNDERKRTDKSVSGEYVEKGPNPAERNVHGSVVSQTGERGDSARVDKRGENAEVQTLTPAQEAKSPKEIPGKNFTITNDINLGEGGVKTKYKTNIEAIRLLKTLEAENRNSTPAEQKILAKYVGWGGLSQVFDVGRSGEGMHAEWRSEAKGVTRSDK